jgi:gluconolactonase
MPLSTIPLSGLRKLGIGLQRPEDVVVSRDGHVWASDQQSACAEVRPDGTLRRVGKAGGAPNGINMDREGRIIIANFEAGPVQRLDTITGSVETICADVGGQRLTAANYPLFDRNGNLWCANSTFSVPWQAALDGRSDGMLFRIRPNGKAEKMADGLRFANGLALDADESHIYVCETAGCDVMRYRLRTDGSIGSAERYGPVLGESWPARQDLSILSDAAATARLGLTDGCGFDVEGNLWVTLVAANRIVAITPGGEVVPIIEDLSGEIMRQPTNVSWGGTDMRDLYIGSITNDYIVHARSPVAGMRLFHQRD